MLNLIQHLFKTTITGHFEEATRLRNLFSFHLVMLNLIQHLFKTTITGQFEEAQRQRNLFFISPRHAELDSASPL
ncbi:hypothetical protein [Christiangramia echinicola]|uniref:hypothetical protein n=1 Tax=Christiangramia echinicola TaxID=279359 RepID=UPI0012EB20C2|nr:hypothetical protein [Christiangramia echinicola]